jgi:hypothetical protein
MKPMTSSIEKISLRAGFITFIALTVYFFAMNLFGLATVLQFRYINFIILLAGIYYAINKIKHESELNPEDFYLKGLAIGVTTSTVAIFLFSFFMGVYLSYFNPDLLKYIQTTVSVGTYINGLSVFLILTLEGGASALIIVFCLMQYLKSKVPSHAGSE